MRRTLAALIAIVAVAAAACNSAGGNNEMAEQTGGKTAVTPGDDSVEAGFARDMSVHHAQAVAMAEAIRDRTQDPDLELLATDIALGQQNQIGRMTGWLDEWGLGIGTTNEQMAWMDSDIDGTDTSDVSGMDMGSIDMSNGSSHLDPETGLMPGMATRPQVTALSTLPVAEAEISFLQLMIVHHTAGIDMARAALALTDHPSVVRLATSIVNSQQAELTVMTDMLAKRGVTS